MTDIGREWRLVGRLRTDALSALDCGPRRLALLRCRREVVEVDHRVRLGPDSKFSCSAEGLVVRVDDPGTVKEDLEMVTLRVDGKLMPDAALHLPVPSRKLDPLALH